MHRLCHKIACFRPLVSYVAGLSCDVGSLRPAWMCLLTAVWFLCLHRILLRRTASLWPIRWMPGAAVFCMWLGIGLMVGERSRVKTEMPAGFSEGSSFMALVEVTALPQEREKTWKLGVRIREPRSDPWYRRKLVVYLPKEEGAGTLKWGDRLWMEVAPTLPEPAANRAFDYTHWLRTKGYTATAYVKHWRWVSNAGWWNVKALAGGIQDKLVSVFRRSGLSDEALVLVSAMTLGARGSMPDDLNAAFSAAGVTHILSVSGLHVGIVFVLLRISLFFLGYTERSRRVRDVLIVVCLWIFACITGLSPAVCRAVLMGTLLLLGGLLERTSSPINTVLFSAWLQLLFDPLLLYDVGFQLSYGAVIGLVVLVPYINRGWTPSSVILRYVWGMVSVSLVAQAVTAPLTIHYFGQFPTYFLLANLVAVPLSGVLIYVSVASLLVSAFPVLFHPVSACLSFCARLFLVVVQGVGNMPGSLCQGLSLPVDQVVACYVLMGGLLAWIGWKKRAGLKVCLLCLLFVQCRFLVDKILFQIGT